MAKLASKLLTDELEHTKEELERERRVRNSLIYMYIYELTQKEEIERERRVRNSFDVAEQALAESAEEA